MFSKIIACLLLAVVKTQTSQVTNDIVYHRQPNQIDTTGWLVIQGKEVKNDTSGGFKSINSGFRSETSTLLKAVSAGPTTISPERTQNDSQTDVFFQEEFREEAEIRSMITRIAKNVDALLLERDDTSIVEGRGKKKKYRKGEMQFLIKALLGLKIALLGVVLPLGVIVAKVLSWKAVTLSLMAFMLAKIVFVKNLFMGKSTPASAAPTQPTPPIVIHSSAPSHEHVWKRHSEPQIHVKPEVHVHQSEEQFHGWDDTYTNRNWRWGEGRNHDGSHDIAYRNWINKKR